MLVFLSFLDVVTCKIKHTLKHFTTLLRMFCFTCNHGLTVAFCVINIMVSDADAEVFCICDNNGDAFNAGELLSCLLECFTHAQHTHTHEF